MNSNIGTKIDLDYIELGTKKAKVFNNICVIVNPDKLIEDKNYKVSSPIYGQEVCFQFRDALKSEIIKKPDLFVRNTFDPYGYDHAGSKFIFITKICQK
jgi:hypothetical protein